MSAYLMCAVSTNASAVSVSNSFLNMTVSNNGVWKCNVVS